MARKSKAVVWVVEMWNDERERWEPTVGTGLIKCEAMRERLQWVANNPNDRYRVSKYQRVEVKHGK